MTSRRILIGGGVLLVLAMVIALAFLVGIVFGRGEAGQQETAEKNSQSAETTETRDGGTTESAEQKEETTSSDELPPLGAAVGQGETARFPDRTVTVNDVQRGYIFPSNIPRPGPGNEFVIVNLTIENTSSQPIPVNSYNFESQDSEGARVRAEATQVPPDAIFLGSLAPNGELTGNLIFEVQQGDPTIRIVYRPQ